MDRDDNGQNKSVLINIDGIEPGLIKPASQIPPREMRPIPPIPPPIRRTSAPRANVSRDFYKPSSDGYDEDDVQDGEKTAEDDGPVSVYEPGGAFGRIEVYRWKTRTKFYERFADEALALARKSYPECAKVPMTIPPIRYGTMTPDQLRYYLWWRHNARRGIFLECDAGYYSTYIAELLNITEVIPPKTGIRMLCSAFTAFRRAFPYLGMQTIEWICDYSLIHNVPVPRELLAESMAYIMGNASLPDVFMQAHELTEDVHNIELLCDFYYKDSVYYNDNRELYDLHIPEAARIGMQAVLDMSGDGYVRETEIRETYFGARIASRNKRRVVIRRTDEPPVADLRKKALMILKYAENKVRALCSVNVRYSVSRIPPEVKKAIDGYFSPFFSKKSVYECGYNEKLYEAPSTGIDVDDARQIERRSWDNAILLEGMTEEDIAFCGDDADGECSENRSNPPEDLPCDGIGEKKPPCDDIPASAEEDVFRAFLSAIGEKERECLSALTVSRGEFRRVCSGFSALPDAVEEKINSVAYDVIGDTVTDENGISEFYIDDIKTAFRTFENGERRK